MLRTLRIFTLVSTLALGACAGGGGGSGGGVVTPPPPPPPPYASNCATTPGALSCSTTTDALGGPQYGLRLDGSTTDYTFDSLQVDRKGTAQFSDDVYTFGFFGGASVIYRIYNDLKSKNDGLGPVRTGTNVVRDLFSGELKPGDGSTLTLFDITNVLQGGLDYVQLGKVAPNPANGAYTYFAVGRANSPPVMPTTGSARFDGGTRGAYTNASGAVFSTASDVTLTANFGSGAITGSTSNFKMTDAGGAAVTPPAGLGFNFTGSIAGAAFSGTASNAAMTGTVNGAFYGEPGGSPVEAALGYSLKGAGGEALIGVGGLKKN